MVKKQTLQDVIDYCESVGLQCLEEVYVNGRTKMRFKCGECSNEFTNYFIDMKHRKVNKCPNCSRKDQFDKVKENSWNELRKFCEDNNLEMISTEYINNTTPLKFKCTSCSDIFERAFVVFKVNKSTLCKKCTYKNIGEKTKYNYEYVKDYFLQNGCILLSDTYENNKKPLKYICECGKEAKISFSNFIQGQRCKSCALIKIANSNRTPYEDVKEIFEKEGCKLISDTFIHSNIPLDYICECGNISRVKLPAFIRGTRCRKCAGNEKYSYDDVYDYFEQYNCKLLSTNYNNIKSKLKYICTCGEEAETTYWNFRRSPYKKCIKCANKMNGQRIKGDKHPQYNPNISDEDRIDRRLSSDNKLWRYSVYKRDNFTCQCCNKKGSKIKINAHHLNGYNWCKEQRYDIENGITLCEECHIKFHQSFGYGNNTKEQFDIFMKERRI